MAADKQVEHASIPLFIFIAGKRGCDISRSKNIVPRYVEQASRAAHDATTLTSIPNNNSNE